MVKHIAIHGLSGNFIHVIATSDMKRAFLIIIGLCIYLSSTAQMSDAIDVSDLDVYPVFFGCKLSTLSEIEQFECSTRELVNFVFRHLTLPPENERYLNSGKFVIGFIIEKNGFISNTMILEGANPEINRILLDTIYLMNEKGYYWTPGYLNDTPVRVTYKLPLYIN